MNVFGMVTTAKSSQYTPYALGSLRENTTFGPNDRVILIDNDNSFDKSVQSFPNLHVISNSSPKSFAANMNYLLNEAKTRGADAFLLNNDLVFTPGWAEPLLECADAIVAPLSNREVQYELQVRVKKTGHATGGLHLNMVMDLDELKGHEHALTAIAEAHRSGAKGYWSVYVLPFFCVRIPYHIVLKLGDFDESFGKAGGEDFDYCLRAYLAGYSVQFALSSYVLHFGGKSTYSGAESESERRTRERQFQTVFERKWGPALADLILREQANVLTERPELHELERSGKLREVIEKLQK